MHQRPASGRSAPSLTEDDELLQGASPPAEAVDNNSIYIDYCGMTRPRALSPATRAALLVLADSSAGLHGYDITRQAGVSPGTLYPMLARLESQGLLTASWSPSPDAGRPPRHVYRLTASGVAVVQDLRATERAPRSGTLRPGVQG